MTNKIKLLLVAIISMVAVTGCSGKSPSTVVEEYFKEAKKGESANVSEYIVSTESEKKVEEETKEEKEEAKEDPIMNEAMELYLSEMNVKVLSENIEEDKAIVEVEYTGYNMSNMFLALVQDSLVNAFSGVEMSDADMSRSFLEKVKDGKIETRKGNINLTKVDKSWKIDPDDDYNTLVFGSAEMSPNKTK